MVTDERKMKKKKKKKMKTDGEQEELHAKETIERGNERRMAFVCAKKGGNRWKNRRNGS